ncbi:hypothetical protein F7731_06170 [Cytobacillus depressus]|uniref:Uncharacterized protein n=1 Tax=Cytobacillus depressus TaxID=1602942 RepID=A0A6L3V8T8_9BACI|nr:hypothetical protein [Cytobacillus depressus]KAB2337205.1 hypothetical protein F7731_06170 [Cytobacillus depressus]
MDREFESEKKYIQSDRLTQFMFGRSEQPSTINLKDDGNIEISDGTKIVEDKTEEVDYENLNERYHRNRFDDLMFGERPHHSSRGRTSDIPLADHLNHIINNIDFMELMDNIDTLVSSAKQLKPLYSKVTPFFTQFLNKK